MFMLVRHPFSDERSVVKTTDLTMEAFEGQWRLDNSDNFEAFLKELEINYVMRKLAFLVVPTVVFRENPSGIGWIME